MIENLVHATAVEIDNHGVLIRGASGSGKTSLALSLMESGATLIADDYTQLHPHDGRVIATAPDTIKGKIEVRGFGLIDVAFKGMADLHLVVDIVPHAEVPRMPDSPCVEICGIFLPRLFLGVHDAAASGKIKAVLNRKAAESP